MPYGQLPAPSRLLFIFGATALDTNCPMIFRYQFLLPNLFGASFALMILALVAFFLPETVDSGKGSIPRPSLLRCDKCPEDCSVCES